MFILDSCSSRRRLHIGLGRAMLSRGDLFSARSGLGVQMLQRVYSNPSCDGEDPHAAWLQTVYTCTGTAAGAKPESAG